jgi:hypothetical protein
MNSNSGWTHILGLSLAIQMLKQEVVYSMTWYPFSLNCFHGLFQCLTFHLPLLFVSENTKHVAYFYWTLSSNFNHCLEIFNCPIDHCGSISTIDLTIENFQLLPFFFGSLFKNFQTQLETISIIVGLWWLKVVWIVAWIRATKPCKYQLPLIFCWITQFKFWPS